jgi:putative alpha-1,2-mannosidase
LEVRCTRRSALTFANGRDFRVEASNNWATNIVDIQAATFEWKPRDIAFITWEQILAGGTLHCLHGPMSRPNWGKRTWETFPLYR